MNHRKRNSTSKGPVVGEIFDDLTRKQRGHSGWREHGGKYSSGRDVCKVQGGLHRGFRGVTAPAVTFSEILGVVIVGWVG